MTGHSLAPIWAKAAGLVMELDDLVATGVTYDQILVKLESASLVNVLKCSSDETRPWHETISADLIFDCLCNDPGNLQEVVTIIAHFVGMKDNRVLQKTTTNNYKNDFNTKKKKAHRTTLLSLAPIRRRRDCHSSVRGWKP